MRLTFNAVFQFSVFLLIFSFSFSLNLFFSFFFFALFAVTCFVDISMYLLICKCLPKTLKLKYELDFGVCFSISLCCCCCPVVENERYSNELPIISQRLLLANCKFTFLFQVAANGNKLDQSNRGCSLSLRKRQINYISTHQIYKFYLACT